MSANNVIPIVRRRKPKTSDIIADAVDQGKPLPLQVLLDAMWRHLDSAKILEASEDPGDQVSGRVYFDRACRLASEAAPYLHAKQQSTTISGDSENPIHIARANPFERLSDETATRLLKALTSGEMTIEDIHEQIS